MQEFSSATRTYYSTPIVTIIITISTAMFNHRRQKYECDFSSAILWRSKEVKLTKWHHFSAVHSSCWHCVTGSINQSLLREREEIVWTGALDGFMFSFSFLIKVAQT